MYPSMTTAVLYKYNVCITNGGGTSNRKLIRSLVPFLKKKKKKTIKTAEHAILEHPDSWVPGRLLRRPAKQRRGLESAG